ncbi:MAG: metal ABC transporter ATP-binding protein [Thermodesulfobacteriota bacterium]
MTDGNTLSSPPVLVHDVSFSYRQNPVLEDVHLRVQKGDFLAMIGPNGGGKTTLLKLLLGLLKPEKGEVRIFGRSPEHSVQRIGYVPQHSNIRHGFPITVEQVVLLGMRNKHKKGISFSREDREAARSCLIESGIEKEFFQRRMDSLSGGQRQRVFIARAMADSPELLVFDEPTSNIDPEGRFCFFELLSTLHKTLTIIVVSHDLSITALDINSIACVNKKLIHSRGKEINEDMLSLLYGVHHHSCPMDRYIQDVNAARARQSEYGL